MLISESQIRYLIRQKIVENYKTKLLKEDVENNQENPNPFKNVEDFEGQNVDDTDLLSILGVKANKIINNKEAIKGIKNTYDEFKKNEGSGEWIWNSLTSWTGSEEKPDAKKVNAFMGFGWKIKINEYLRDNHDFNKIGPNGFKELAKNYMLFPIKNLKAYMDFLKNQDKIDKNIKLPDQFINPKSENGWLLYDQTKKEFNKIMISLNSSQAEVLRNIIDQNMQSDETGIPQYSHFYGDEDWLDYLEGDEGSILNALSAADAGAGLAKSAINKLTADIADSAFKGLSGEGGEALGRSFTGETTKAASKITDDAVKVLQKADDSILSKLTKPQQKNIKAALNIPKNSRELFHNSSIDSYNKIAKANGLKLLEYKKNRRLLREFFFLAIPFWASLVIQAVAWNLAYRYFDKYLRVEDSNWIEHNKLYVFDIDEEIYQKIPDHIEYLENILDVGKNDNKANEQQKDNQSNFKVSKEFENAINELNNESTLKALFSALTEFVLPDFDKGYVQFAGALQNKDSLKMLKSKKFGFINATDEQLSQIAVIFKEMFKGASPNAGTVLEDALQDLNIKEMSENEKIDFTNLNIQNLGTFGKQMNQKITLKNLLLSRFKKLQQKS